MAYIYDDSQTYTGEIVNFTSTDKAQITSISVPLTYTQDLHGYANPWPGGGGKNKFLTTLETGTKNQVTATVDSDGFIHLSGTASATTIFALGGFTFSAGEYYITMCPPGGSTSTYRVYASFGSNDIGNGWTRTFTQETEITFQININSGTNVDGLVFKPMICLSSEGTEFAPYANICPISGLTGLSVYRTGKNLFDYNLVDSVNSTATNMRMGYYWTIPGTYTVSASSSGIVCRKKSADGTYGTANYLPATFTETITDGEAIIIFNPTNGASKDTTVALMESTKVMLEVGSSASTYEPYQGTTYAVDWSTQAGTVYHGTVDPVVGQLTVDWAMVDLGSLTWYYNSTLYPTWPFFYAVVNEKKNGWNNGIMEAYRLTSGQYTRSEDFVFTCASYYSAKNVIIRDSRFTDPSAFKNAVTGQKYVYELATPLTYQLTPKQIAALTDNYVWASNGASITVTVSDVLHDFQGWLLKVGSGMTLVPTEMIKAETYKVSPNQRMEETAERDSTGVLWRETVPNMPPKIEFNTPAAYDTDVNSLNAIFRAAYSNEQERKLTVAFYDPEENVYKSWECYMPNIDFPIRTIDIDAKTIFYDEIRYAFIGY